MADLETLLTAKTAEAVKGELLAELEGRGSPVTDWNDGGVERTLIEIEAKAAEDLYALVPVLARGGFMQLADEGWLELQGMSQYQELRKHSVFTLETLRLTAAAGFGPYTIEPGQLIVTTASGLVFRNVNGGLLPAGGTLDLEGQAESPGAAYNVPAGSLTVLQTPIPGVSCTNPAGLRIRSGADIESPEAFRARCTAKWATLADPAADPPRGALEYIALSSHPAITQVLVKDQHPRGQGTVDVVVWGAGGGIGADALAAADAALQARKLLADIETRLATEVVVPIVGTVYVRAAFLAAAQAAGVAAIQALQGATPIEGTSYRSALADALFAEGVRNVVLTAPAAEVTPLGVDGAVTYDLTGLTYQAV